MDFAANFTAIDFETANRRPDSACQLAAVRVREGRIADSQMWMIRPRPLFFARTHIAIHGITPQRVREQYEFGKLWPEIAEYLNDDCLVAHNARFDINVLLACLRSHRHPIPELQFVCTRNVSRRSWPSRRRYGLKPLADWLGIRFQHHDALEDALTCAKILLAAGIDSEASDLDDLEARLRLRRGRAGAAGITDVRSNSRRSYRTNSASGRKVAESTARYDQPPIERLLPGPPGSPVQANHCPTLSDFELQRLLVRAEFIQPLSGRSVVVSGRLKMLTREQARSLTECCGGRFDETLSEHTDLLISGSASKDPAGAQTPGPNSKCRVIDEDQFLGLIIARSP